MKHAFSVVTDLYRLCSRCGKPDLASNKRLACRPLPPEQIEPALQRRMALAAKFRGRPSETERPVVAKQSRRKVPRGS